MAKYKRSQPGKPLPEARDEKPEWAVRVLAAIEAASKNDAPTNAEANEPVRKAVTDTSKDSAAESSKPEPLLEQDESQRSQISALEEAQILVDREAVAARSAYERERTSLLSNLRTAQEQRLGSAEKRPILDALTLVESQYSAIWRRLESGIRGAEILYEVEKRRAQEELERERQNLKRKNREELQHLSDEWQRLNNSRPVARTGEHSNASTSKPENSKKRRSRTTAKKGLNHQHQTGKRQPKPVTKKPKGPATRIQKQSSVNDFERAIRALDAEYRREAKRSKEFGMIANLASSHPFKTNNRADERVYLTHGVPYRRSKKS
ncbi:hypothetical protein [Corynebacterium qintianiae]|uniref:hypothetical protein n=1 Tax=Corynebacterium qintianiae TaxID=2709392 RepID=UPI0013EC6057|nr:hypothetical protein [Corynebacterium qintianiae]